MQSQRAVLALAVPCPYSEWVLLRLPTGLHAAFWYAGLDDEERCLAIVNGRARDVCAYRSRDVKRVLAFMAANRNDQSLNGSTPGKRIAKAHLKAGPGLKGQFETLVRALGKEPREVVAELMREYIARNG